MGHITIRADIYHALPPTASDAGNGTLIDSRDYRFSTEHPHLLEILDPSYVATVGKTATTHAEFSDALGTVLDDLADWLPLYTCAELSAIGSDDEESVKLLAVMGEVKPEEQ